MPEFILERGGIQDKFLKLRTDIQIYGGAFGNGKTTALVIKSLQLAKDYPGSTGLLARSTYPKLNDTLRKEFVKWCPPEWIKSFPMGQNASNICTMKNGTTIYFRYIAQQGKSAESTTSNLLSATYDWAGIDQVEDPEITHKDILDLFGRMRGRTIYRGEDPTMPKIGPQYMMLACNPTANWVYTKLVRPLHMYQKSGIVTDELAIRRDIDGKAILHDGKPELLISIVEGSTYELRHIHEADGGNFIARQESMYTGQMRDRFLLGKWASYEGLVYPLYDSVVNGLHQDDIINLLDDLRGNGYEPTWIEGYDYGQVQPSCYMLAFVTPSHQVIICDGFYKKEYNIDEQAAEIKSIRERWASFNTEFDSLRADPSIFGRKTVNTKVVGKTVAAMFQETDLRMLRGNNDVANGITKVNGYMVASNRSKHPITGNAPAPRLYCNLNLRWFDDEVTSYFWKQDNSGQRIDVPNDKNDHAMDTLKYMLSHMPDVGKYFTPAAARVPAWMRWNDAPSAETSRDHRYG